jgi:hypothetical protein
MLLSVSTTARIYSRFSSRQLFRLAVAPRQYIPLKVVSNLHSVSPQLFNKSYFHAEAGGSFDPSNDTIYAVSTAPGRAGIAIVRVSGPACLKVGLPGTSLQHTDWYRYTKPSALSNHLLSPDMLHCEHSMIH